MFLIPSRPIAALGLPDSLAARASSATLRWGVGVKLYRIDKVVRLGGALLKRKHVLASSDNEAMRTAEESVDCPTCEVVAEDGKRVGSVV